LFEGKVEELLYRHEVLSVMKSLGVEDGSVNEDIIRGEEGAVYGLRRVKGKRVESPRFRITPSFSANPE